MGKPRLRNAQTGDLPARLPHPVPDVTGRHWPSQVKKNPLPWVRTGCLHCRGLRWSEFWWPGLSARRSSCSRQGCPLARSWNSPLATSNCRTARRRLEAVAGHKLTGRCSALLETLVLPGQLALFPWTDRPQIVNLWLRICRNAGLLRRQPRDRTPRFSQLLVSFVAGDHGAHWQASRHQKLLRQAERAGLWAVPVSTSE